MDTQEVFITDRSPSRPLSTPGLEQQSSRSSSRGGEQNIRLVSSLYVEKEPCKRCYKYIYPMELIGPIMGYRYHKQCFKCAVCQTHLDFKSYRTNLNDLNDRAVYCTSHYPRNGKYTGNYNFAENVEFSKSDELLNVS